MHVCWYAQNKIAHNNCMLLLISAGTLPPFYVILFWVHVPCMHRIFCGRSNPHCQRAAPSVSQSHWSQLEVAKASSAHSATSHSRWCRSTKSAGVQCTHKHIKHMCTNTLAIPWPSNPGPMQKSHPWSLHLLASMPTWLTWGAISHGRRISAHKLFMIHYYYYYLLY